MPGGGRREEEERYYNRETKGLCTIYAMAEASGSGTSNRNRNRFPQKTGGRKWWYTEFGKCHIARPTYGLEFTLMCYNILAQTLLENHPYLYYHCKKEYLTWEYRSRNLLQEINRHKADILCLEEVQEDHYYETLRPSLNKWGYYGVYKKRTGENVDGCAIFFNMNLFRLEKEFNIEFNKSSVNILDRDNIGLIVVLRPRDVKFKHLKLICAATHLLFNPRRGDVKLAQLRFFLAEIEKVARKKNHSVHSRDYHPIIFCGDLNSEPFYPLYNFIVHGFINYNHLCAGNVSGQPEGFNKGSFLTENALTLAPLGIDQNTCYELSSSDESRESRSSSLTKTNNLDLALTAQGRSASNTSTAKRGCFYHPLNFLSTYGHVNKRGDREVTIGQSKSLMNADYIFYSVKKKSGAKKTQYVEEGNLKHIGSYGLLHASEVKQFIPNTNLSSDHFCLLSQFLLSC